MIVLRALAALLSYPSGELRRALPEIADAISLSPLVAPRERKGLLALTGSLAEGDLLEIEERYVELFDRGRASCLNLFEHLHGDSRDRGTAMIELKRLYESAGFELATRELPDYLPVVLEYLSCRNLAEARAMLSDCSHILKAIASALMARGSAYTAILQTLIVMAGKAPVDAPASGARAGGQSEDLDREWAEEPAFASTPEAAAGRPSPRAAPR
ncbi:MAG: nitrate reductase molybdenum cofactor assembly chaperone [Beijerinckiaceae bacterium]|nr:nitrate reductase molybdenum cofactor assembly chaperone [Beijerinckiaceae bacterium]